VADPFTLQIADKIAALIRSAGTVARVVDFGTAWQISPEQMPYVDVSLGDDQATDPDGQRATTYIDSTQLYYIDLYQSLAGGVPLRTLEELRAQIHTALMADETLGLAFVHQIHYGGALEPITDDEGELTFYMRRTLWPVEYRFSRGDPTTL